MPTPLADHPLTTRFAPSPTGRLHQGSAAAALFAWHRAREQGGRFLLRIEDIDRARCRSEYTAAIIDDLRWLGLDWDGDVRVQSQHFADYRAALDRLAADALLYPCFCSRADIATEIARSASAPHGPANSIDNGTIYPGTCRHLDPADARDRIAAGAPHALRLDVAEALRRSGPLTWLEAGEGRVPAHPEAFGDPVLARRDTPASYHLCVTHDDALQGVTLVTRGLDLRPATSLHRLLQAVMHWPEPAYAHHPLKLNAANQRLAKRDAAIPLRCLGLSPDALRAQLGFD